jgi:hypothetical protein
VGDAGIPARVIDELISYAGGHRGGERSAMGLHHRHTTPEIEARAVATIEQRLAISFRLLPRSSGSKDDH